MIDIDTLGTLPASEVHDERLTPLLDAMEDAVDDRNRSVAYARQVLEIEPACAAALLVLAEHAETRAERIALLKEVLSIGKREFAAAAPNDAAWWSTFCTRTSINALAELGDELAEVGDAEGAVFKRRRHARVRATGFRNLRLRGRARGQAVVLVGQSRRIRSIPWVRASGECFSLSLSDMFASLGAAAINHT